MQLHDLKPNVGSTHRRKKVGRGPGSGHGKTSTRGMKGQAKHGTVNPNFEGGQTPLHRRLPQLRGFKAINKQEYAIVNIGQLQGFDEGTDVTPQFLVDQGLLREGEQGFDATTNKMQIRIKVLGDGSLTRKLTVHAHKFSKSAQAAIEAAGGAVVTI